MSCWVWTSSTLVETDRCTWCLEDGADAWIRFASDSRLAYLSDLMPISGLTANVNEADFFAGFLPPLPPWAILEIRSRKPWLLPPPPVARPLLRSLIVVRLMCSNPSFRLWRIGFASGFDLISFRWSSFNWPPLAGGLGGATRGSVALWSNALLQFEKGGKRERVNLAQLEYFSPLLSRNSPASRE